MAKYFFYVKNDQKQEPISIIYSSSRLKASKLFAKRKKMKLKQFLSIFSISK